MPIIALPVWPRPERGDRSVDRDVLQPHLKLLVGRAEAVDQMAGGHRAEVQKHGVRLGRVAQARRGAGTETPGKCIITLSFCHRPKGNKPGWPRNCIFLLAATGVQNVRSHQQ